MNILCSICNDIIIQADNIHVTKCGHIFHYHCLSQWIERSKTCPQCRNKVTASCMFRMYPTISSENTDVDATMLQSRLDDAKLQLREQSLKLMETVDRLDKMKTELLLHEETIKNYEKKLVSRDSAINGLKEQLQFAMEQNREVQQLRAQNESLNTNIHMLNGLQRVLNATSEEVEQMLQGYTDVKTVATFATALKRALCEAESKKNETRNQLHATKAELSRQRKKYNDLFVELGRSKEKYLTLVKKLLERRAKNGVDNTKVNADEEILNQSTMSVVLSEQNPSVETASENNNSITSMVDRIESSHSPYWNLRQSSLAFSTLEKQILLKIKPSECSLIRQIKDPSTGRSESAPSTSIFNKKEALPLKVTETASVSELNSSYDGLGGHSALDTFPVKRPTPLSNKIPKLSTKHKLKRPNPTGNQNIVEMWKKTKQI